MKKLFTLLLLGGVMTMNAQQVDGSFQQEWVDCYPWSSTTNYNSNEEKNGTQPEGWKISNVYNSTITIPAVGEKTIESNNIYVTLKNGSLMGQNFPAYITLGTPWSTAQSKGLGTIKEGSADGGTWGGINFTSHPDALSLKYQRGLENGSSERASVIVYLWKGTYTQKNVPANVTHSLFGGYVNTTPVDMLNRERNILGYSTTVGDEVSKSEDAELIASGEYYITGSTAEWTDCIVDIDYKSNSNPEMLNIIISANDYFADRSQIKSGNSLAVDDVKLIYRSQLTSIEFNGKPIPNFSKDQYEYVINDEWSEGCLSGMTTNGKAAKISTSYDPSSKTATVSISNEEGTDETGESYHLYKFTFTGKQIITNYTNFLSVNIDGVTCKPEQTQIQLIQDGDKYSLSLKNFTFILDGDIAYIGNINVNLTPGKNPNSFTADETITIEAGDLEGVDFWLGPLLPPCPISLYAKIENDQLKANINIDMSETLGQIIKVIFAPSLTIDGSSDVNITTNKLYNVTLSRTFPAGWNTICLPFATTTAAFGEGVKAQAFISADNNGLNFGEVTELEANKPYLIYFKEAKETPTYFGTEITSTTPVSVTFGDFTFCGSYEASISMAGKYGVADQGNVQKLMLGGEGSTLKATRAYFTKSGDQPAMININLDGNATGIENIEQNQADIYDVYNLQGQLIRKNATSLNGLTKGIYIVNGKKVMVK